MHIGDIPLLHTTMISEPLSQDAQLAPAAISQLKRTRTRRRLALTLLGIFLIASVIALINTWRSASQSVNAVRIRTAVVTRGVLVRDASVNGKVVAAVSPTLFSTAVSTVNLKANAGDTVKKGDVLAELESPDLTDALKREQSNIEQLEAEFARQQILSKKQKLTARRDADQAEIERVSAKRAYERVQAVGVGIVSKVDFLKAEDALKSAEIRAKHAEAATDLESQNVELELKTKFSQLQNQRLVYANAKRRVDELKLRAPMDGFIGTLSVANRSVVPANTPIMTLVDLSQLELELEIPETYVVDLGIGMRVEIDIVGVKHIGTLSAISPEVVKNQVLARARFKDAQPAGLRQNQRISARILIEEKPNVVLVQRGSFVEQGGGKLAYVMEGNIAVRRSVKLGASSIAAVEILSGLREGEAVVVSGSEVFENAERVLVNN
jgi:HlyD family secretion protein